MTKMDYIMNNMQVILDTANAEIRYYGVRLDTIMLTNCLGDTYDAKFIFSANSNPSYENKQSIERIVRTVLQDFVSKNIPSPYSMNRSEYVYYF